MKIFKVISAYTEKFKLIHLVNNPFWPISANELYKGPVIVLREINSERNKEEGKEAFRREKQQCSESKIKRNRYTQSTKAKEKEESSKKNKCGEVTELEES